jgi:hypothetical protein
MGTWCPNVGKYGLATPAMALAWTTGTDASGYSTPVPLDDNGQQLLVLMGYRTFAAVEPLTGSVMWEYPWVNGLPGNIADPVVDGNELFVSSGYNKGSALLRASGGQVTRSSSEEYADLLQHGRALGDIAYGRTIVDRT